MGRQVVYTIRYVDERSEAFSQEVCPRSIDRALMTLASDETEGSMRFSLLLGLVS